MAYYLVGLLKTCLMNFEIFPTPDFEHSFKKLSKRHKSLIDDFKEFEKSLLKNPFQGVELSPGIRKIRMAISSKGKGKSGGARIITYTVLVSQEAGEIFLIDIFDKTDFSTADKEVIKKIIEELDL